MEEFGLRAMVSVLSILALTTLGWICVHRWDPSLANKDAHLTDYGIRAFLSFVAGCIAVVVLPFAALWTAINWIQRFLR